MRSMGKRNQIYGRWKRLLPNPEDPKEIYLVLEKDEPMQLKYIRQFENMFQGKDVIISVVTLIRNKKDGKQEDNETRPEPIEKEKPKKKEKEDAEEEPGHQDSPFWEVE